MEPTTTTAPQSLRCAHYQRNCHKFCDQCGEFYACRFCHDDAIVDHKFDRFATRKMKCLLCNTEQDFGCECSQCHEPMGRYYCGICKLIDNDPKKHIYHCADCGICRIGKGIGVDMVHCGECGSCVAINHKELGNCKKDLLTGKCPVCLEAFFDSKKSVTLMPCKHPIHRECLEQLARHDFRCPLCSKSFADISGYNAAVEDYLKQHTTEFVKTDKTSVISCSQCEKRGEAPYHPLYHKCPHCLSCNTVVIETKEPPNKVQSPPSSPQPASEPHGSSSSSAGLFSAVADYFKRK